MKRFSIIFGILLVFLIAGSACHRGGRREMRMTGMDQNFSHHMRGMNGNMYGHRFGMMRSGIGFGMGRGMGQPGMRPGMMAPGGGNGMGNMGGRMDSINPMPMGTGWRIMESIPNVTDNQKKQIDDLIKKQQDAIQKLREEMFAKMKSTIAENRTEMLNILTPEQKKFLEDKDGKSSSFSKK
jgi:hypothetical protein